MTEIFPSPCRNAGKALPRTILSFGSFLLAMLVGYFLVDFFLSESNLQCSFLPMRPYEGCDFAAEYAIRAAFLCKDTIFQAAAIWLSAYVCFDKQLLSILFAVRGFALGVAAHMCAFVGFSFSLLLSLAAYLLITIIFFILNFAIRTENGTRPIRDTITYWLMASGFSSGVLILTSLFI